LKKMSGEDLAVAIENGEDSTVQLLIDSNNINGRIPRRYNPPALVFAVRRNKIDIAAMLLRAGARIDEVDDRGFTACHYAACCSGVDCDFLAMLLAYRPNLELKTAGGDTALVFASMYNHDCCAMLIRAGSPLENVDLFTLAVINTATIQALLDRGCNLKQLRGCYEKTLLHSVMSRTVDAAAVFDMLVYECGIDIDVRDAGGQSCLFYAVQNRNTNLVFSAICAGADVNCKDACGTAPLHESCSRSCTILLLAAGADPNVADCRMKTPLHRTTRYSRTPVCALIAGGANLDLIDKNGKSAREVLLEYNIKFCESKVEKDRQDIADARQKIANAWFKSVCASALQVCIALEPLRLPALQTCEILLFACSPVAQLVPFYKLWKIATTVKHFSLL
jgi:ankyrin repeat protein